MTNKKKNKDNYYIDPIEFTNEMTPHAEECRAAREKGLPMPRCPESIGAKFLLLAENVSRRGNFYRYPFREDMVSDAIENMLKYRYNFDPLKAQKPETAAFSYFTQYAMFAFYNRIRLEKKELEKKARYVQKVALHEYITDAVNDYDRGNTFGNDYIDYLINWMEEKMADEEKKKVKKE